MPKIILTPNSERPVTQIERWVEMFGHENVTLLPDGQVELILTDEQAEMFEGPAQPADPLQKLQLGKQTKLPVDPQSAIIDTVPNKNYPNHFVARFSAPEFTSMCPVTGQPDFARIFIDYIPGTRMIESKALKLFLGSFRNHGAFHEECTMMIKDRLIAALMNDSSAEQGPHCGPIWFRIAAFWYPRGGIPIDVFWQSGAPPIGVLIPDLPKLDFAGR